MNVCMPLLVSDSARKKWPWTQGHYYARLLFKLLESEAKIVNLLLRTSFVLLKLYSIFYLFIFFLSSQNYFYRKIVVHLRIYVGFEFCMFKNFWITRCIQKHLQLLPSVTTCTLFNTFRNSFLPDMLIKNWTVHLPLLIISLPYNLINNN